MDKELTRLASFTSWPDSAQAQPLLLAKTGFFYSGTGDRVTCFQCSSQLDDWKLGDSIVERHRYRSPNCPLQLDSHQENVPLVPVSIGNQGITETDLVTTNYVSGSDKIQEIYRRAVTRATKRGIFSKNPVNEIDRSRPDYNQLRKERLRFNTFHDWPQGACADPQILARDGLFYTGLEDRVQCAFCRGFMRNWEPKDIPSAEHKKHFPDCPFVRGLDVGNISITGEILASDNSRKTSNIEGHQHMQNCQPLRTESIRPSIIEQIRHVPPPGCTDPPKYPQFSDVKRRIESFNNGKVSPGQTAEALAEAGWFFIGPGDKVQCFHCGGNLKDWEPEDDPWDEHKRWYSNCSYCKTHRPAARRQLHQQTCPTNVQPTAVQFRVEPREVKARMDTAKVRAILDMGYSRELVRKAIEDRLSTTGDDFPNAESLLEAIFLITPENPATSASDLASNTNALASHDTGRLLLMPSSSSAAGSYSSSPSSSRSTPQCNGSVHFADSHSLSAPNQSASDSSTLAFQSLASRPSERLSAFATGSADNPQEIATETQSKSKGKRKRTKKKKTSAASNAAAMEEEDQMVEAGTGAQNDPETLAALGLLNLNEIPDEETLEYVEENRRLREARTCKVCMDAEVNTVFLPCGHLVCCSSCSPALRNCPICRTFIRGTVKTFLS